MCSVSGSIWPRRITWLHCCFDSKQATSYLALWMASYRASRWEPPQTPPHRLETGTECSALTGIWSSLKGTCLFHCRKQGPLMFLYHRSSEFKYQTSLSLSYILLECSMLKKQNAWFAHLCFIENIFKFWFGIEKKIPKYFWNKWSSFVMLRRELKISCIFSHDNHKTKQCPTQNIFEDTLFTACTMKYLAKI